MFKVERVRKTAAGKWGVVNQQSREVVSRHNSQAAVVRACMAATA